jgi:hypothetical protein
MFDGAPLRRIQCIKVSSDHRERLRERRTGNGLSFPFCSQRLFVTA